MSLGQNRQFQCGPFPPVEIEADSGYWSGKVTLDGKTLPMSIYIDASVSDAKLKDAASILSEFLTIKERARAAIGVQAKGDDGTILDFFQFHLEEVPDCLPEEVRTKATNEAFLAALELVAVSIHADENAAFQLVLDFSFGRAHSDQVLAVKFRPDGEIDDICHES